MAPCLKLIVFVGALQCETLQLHLDATSGPNVIPAPEVVLGSGFYRALATFPLCSAPSCNEVVGQMLQDDVFEATENQKSATGENFLKIGDKWAPTKHDNVNLFAQVRAHKT